MPVYYGTRLTTLGAGDMMLGARYSTRNKWTSWARIGKASSSENMRLQRDFNFKPEVQTTPRSNTRTKAAQSHRTHLAIQRTDACSPPIVVSAATNCTPTAPMQQRTNKRSNATAPFGVTRTITCRLQHQACITSKLHTQHNQTYHVTYK